MLAYCVVIFQAYFIFMPHLKLQTFNINFLEYFILIDIRNIVLDDRYLSDIWIKI